MDYSEDLTRDIVGGKSNKKGLPVGKIALGVFIGLLAATTITLVVLYARRGAAAADIEAARVEAEKKLAEARALEEEAAKRKNAALAGLTGEEPVPAPNTVASTPNSVVAPAEPWTSYESRGCWKDSSATRVLRTKVPGFSYKDGPAAIPRCAAAAKEAGMKVFGVQTGGECWIDKDPARDYKMLGEATCRADGTGDPYANNIYEWN